MLKYARERITPDLALAFLATDTGYNRKISDTAVDKYARDMLAGTYKDNGQTIVFDETGKLIDGQQRMLAVAKSGVPVEFLVVRGVEFDAIATIDSGRAHTIRDNLTMRHTRNPTGVAAISKILLSLNNGSPAYRPSNAEMLSFVNANPRIEEIAVDSANRKPPVLVSVLGAWRFLAEKNGTERQANEAFEVVCTGIPSYPNDPMHALRERFVNDRITGRKLLLGSPYTAFYMIAHSWNLFLTRQPLRSVKKRDFTKMSNVDYRDFTKLGNTGYRQI